MQRTIIAILTASACIAHASPELEKRVAELEKEVAELKAALAPVMEKEKSKSGTLENMIYFIKEKTELNLNYLEKNSKANIF